MTGIFYSWDCSVFQYQTMCKSSVELGLIYKTLVNKHTCETPLLPRKTNCIHCLRNAGFFGKLNKVIFPLQPKTHFFRDILPERVLFSAAEWSTLMDALLLSRWSMHARVCSSGRNAHIRSSTVVYVSKSHDWKNSQKLVRTRKWNFWHRNTLLYIQIVFRNFVHAWHDNPTL